MNNLSSKRTVLLFLSTFVVYIAFKHQILLGSPCRNSFYLTVSIVENGNLFLDDFNTWGYDVAFIGGHTYSVFAPGASFLSVPAYFLGRAAGLSALNPAAVNIFTAMLNALTVVMTYFLAEELSDQSGNLKPFFVALIFAFASNFWPIAEYQFFNAFSAFFVTMGITMFVKALRKYSLKDNFIAFAILGASILVEYPLILTYLPLVAVHVWRREWKTLLLSTLIFAIATLPVLIYNNIVTGSFFIFPESLSVTTAEWHKRFDLSISHITGSIFNILFSSTRGLLYFSPILILAAPGLIKLWNKNSEVSFMFILLIALNILFYSTFVDPSLGGPGYGARWQTAIIPLMVAPMAVLSFEKRTMKFLSLILLFFSILFAVTGVVLVPVDHWYMYNNLPLNLLSGSGKNVIDSYLLVYSGILNVEPLTVTAIEGVGSIFTPVVLKTYNPLFFPLTFTLFILIGFVLLLKELKETVVPSP